MNYSNELPPLQYNETLSSLQKQHMLSRFPINNVKLPYETTSTNTSISSEYNIGMAISYGKRAYAWFTYYQNKDVCCILELNRDNMIGSSIYFVEIDFPASFSLGTILSGTIYEDYNNGEGTDKPILNINAVSEYYFIVENIFTFNGQTLSTLYSERIQSLYQFFQELFTYNGTPNTKKMSLPFVCAVIWNYDSTKMPLDEIPAEYKTAYTIRYVQYRSSNQIMPLLNVSINKKPIWAPIISDNNDIKTPIPNFSELNNSMSARTISSDTFDYSKPIYKQTALFMVMAEIHHDVYFLYLRDKEGKWVKFQHALILNYKTSVWMNGLFRNIKENQNLDYMEESEDEDEFEDTREDKYVDLKKQLIIECVFSSKFKLWTPVRVIDSIITSNILPSIEQFIFSNTNIRPKPSGSQYSISNTKPNHLSSYGNREKKQYIHPQNRGNQEQGRYSSIRNQHTKYSKPSNHSYGAKRDLYDRTTN